MNKDIAAGKWKQLRGSLRETWGELTDDDLDQANGSAEKLSGILQEKYGKAKDTVEKELQDFWSRNG